MNKPKLHLAAFFITLFTSVLGYGQSYNVSLINTNNYAAPGDSLEFELTISSAFSAGNFFQFGLAPLGIQSASQVLPCSTATAAAYSSAGTYTNYLVPSASTPFGSYILLSLIHI